MQINKITILLFILATCFMSSVLIADENIGHIDVKGNRLVDREAIISQITIKPGLVTEEQISDQIKDLYATGFFDQIYAQKEVSTGGQKSLIFQVTEKPLVRKVYITGNEEITEKDLAKVFQFEGRRFLDKAGIQLLLRQGKAFYQSKGYYNAELTHSVTPVGDNQVDITFAVNEGKRLKIKEIDIRGLKESSRSDILDVMLTKEYSRFTSWIFGTGRLSKEVLSNDRLLIRQYFIDNGFLDATVSDPGITIRDNGIYISFDINEGEQYTVAGIEAVGDLVDGDATKTLSDIKLEKGETFKADKMREDVFLITSKFTDVGYAFTNVTPNTKVNPATKEVIVSFAIDKGKEVSVNEIKIKGNTKTYDNVIRRTVRISEGERFSSSKVKRSQDLLQRLGYFEESTITTEPIEGKEDEVDLTVNVREAPTGSFSAGAGYSTSEGALFNAQLSENNIFGTGRRASIGADVGSRRENLSLNVLDPRFMDSFWAVGSEATFVQREFRDFDREFLGGSLSVGYPLEEIFGESFQDISFGLAYQYLDIEISNVDKEDAAQLVIDSEGKSSSSSMTPKLTRNTINNPLNPTDGSRQTLEVELAGLGGSEEFYLFEASNQLYYPLLKTEESGELTFSWRTRFAYGESYDSEDPLPLFRRFFPGGINSVRGYEERTLGPVDEKGNEYGGSKQFINNLELIFPLVNSAGLKGVIFYDVGEAFDDDQSLEFGELRQAYGFGLRWFSPIGPIRVEFGIPIDREEGEDSFVTLFSFGAPL